MIVTTADPVGTESACIRPGGSSFVYESEDSFSQGWAVAVWFKYDWPTEEDRLITFEDLVDSSNDLRIILKNDAGNRKVLVGGLEYDSAQLDIDDWHLLVVTSIKGSNEVIITIDDGFVLQGDPGSVPSSPRIVIGKSPLRDFRGDLWDIRIYDKAISSESGKILYDDAINNAGKRTIPL